jgi:hypothetical protein
MTVFATGRGRMSGRLLMAPGRAILFGLYPSSCTVRCRYAALAIPRIAKDHLVNVGRSGLGPPSELRFLLIEGHGWRSRESNSGSWRRRSTTGGVTSTLIRRGSGSDRAGLVTGESPAAPPELVTGRWCQISTEGRSRSRRRRPST